MPISIVGGSNPNKCHWCGAIFNNPTQRLRHEDRCGPQFQGGGAPTTDFKMSLDPIDLSFAMLKGQTWDKIQGAMGNAMSRVKDFGTMMDDTTSGFVQSAPGAVSSKLNEWDDKLHNPSEVVSSHLASSQGMTPINRLLGTGEYAPQGSERDPLSPDYRHGVGLTGIVNRVRDRFKRFGHGGKGMAMPFDDEGNPLPPGANLSPRGTVPNFVRNRQRANVADREMAARLYPENDGTT